MRKKRNLTKGYFLVTGLLIFYLLFMVFSPLFIDGNLVDVRDTCSSAILAESLPVATIDLEILVYSKLKVNSSVSITLICDGEIALFEQHPFALVQGPNMLKFGQSISTSDILGRSCVVDGEIHYELAHLLLPVYRDTWIGRLDVLDK